MTEAELNKAMQANFELLENMLSNAARLAGEAVDAMRREKPNEAIGAALEIDGKLQDAGALYRAGIALHRSRS